MVKIYYVYNIDYEDVCEYVAYYKDENSIYLVSIEYDLEDRYGRLIRIKQKDKNKKEIDEYEKCYTYTWGENKTREIRFY